MFVGFVFRGGASRQRCRVACVLGVRVVACGGFGATPAATDDDLAYAGEKVADDQILVVGSWKFALQAWSFGICHDPAQASIGTCAESVFMDCENTAAACPDVECTPQALQANGGKPPSS